MSVQTEAHAAQAGLQHEQNHPNQFTAKRQLKDGEAENQNERRLEAHHTGLRGNVWEENLDTSDTGDEATLQNTLVAFDQHGTRC